jgi:hypothetical protein
MGIHVTTCYCHSKISEFITTLLNCIFFRKEARNYCGYDGVVNVYIHRNEPVLNLSADTVCLITFLEDKVYFVQIFPQHVSRDAHKNLIKKQHR